MPWMATLPRHPLFVRGRAGGHGLLLVSTLPVWSFKNFKVPREYALPLLLGVGTFAAVLVADPWAALAGLALIYAVMLPFSRRSFLRLRAAAEARRIDETWLRRPAAPCGGTCGAWPPRRTRS